MLAPDIVNEQPRLEELCRACRDAGRFAFDTEFIRDDTYEPALCLVQIAVDGQVLLVDPTADLKLAPFWDLVADPQIVTIVHAGKEDFELCLRQTGSVPRNVFDVQIAAGFVGLGYPLSLSRLVESTLRKRIGKGQTLTDWLRRPLTPEQIHYAAEDVLHLPRLHSRLHKDIETANRLPWAEEEFRRFEEPEFYKPPPDERVQRLRGSKKLDGLGLLLLERLIVWRDAWAAERNRPIRALIRDDVLVEVARRRPRKERDLEVMRGFPQSKNKKVVREVLDIIEAAGKAPKSEWPKPLERREDPPMTKALLDLLSAVVQAICCEERLNYSLLGSMQRLRELLDYHGGRTAERPAILKGWREKFIGQQVLDLLEGRSDLHLSGWPKDPRILLTARRGKRSAEAK